MSSPDSIQEAGSDNSQPIGIQIDNTGRIVSFPQFATYPVSAFTGASNGPNGAWIIPNNPLITALPAGSTLNYGIVFVVQSTAFLNNAPQNNQVITYRCFDFTAGQVVPTNSNTTTISYNANGHYTVLTAYVAIPGGTTIASSPAGPHSIRLETQATSANVSFGTNDYQSGMIISFE